MPGTLEKQAEEQLESVTESRLATLEEDSKPELPADKPPVKLEEPAKVEPQEEKPVEAVETTPVSKEATVETPVDSTPDEVTEIPAAYMKAAKHQEWTEQEVKDLYETNPEVAERTFARLLETTSTLAKDFSKIGQTKRRLAEEEANRTVAPAVTEKAPELDAEMTEGIKKLREEFGDGMADMFEKIVSRPEPVPVQQPARQPSSVVQENELLAQQVNTFFRDADMTSYADFYGVVAKNDKDWMGLTGSQVNNRYDVSEMANDIIAGAETQGRNVGVIEALEMAHMSISGPVKEKAIREDIESKVVKRSKSITLKSTSAKVPDSKPGEKTDSEFEAATKERLAKLFG